MELEQSHLFAIGILLAWLAGVRVYLTVFGVGLAAAGVMTASAWRLLREEKKLPDEGPRTEPG